MELFVVGTGRCGSTLLGNMLGQHPALLEVSEFFAALDRADVFSHRLVSGREFAEFLDRVDVANEVIHRRGVVPKEVLRPGRESGVPPLMIATLPTQFADPEAVYVELLKAAEQAPKQSFRAHYDQLFAWLMERTGKTAWMERSGTSVEYLSELAQVYPDGKYVYLHRSGPECALSMMNHVVFEFYVSVHDEPPTREELRLTEFGGGQASADDPISVRLRPDHVPVRRYAEFWSHQQALGFKGLARLRPDQVLFVRFEDVLAEPVRALTQIAEFFDLPDGGSWATEAAAMVASSPAARLDELSERDQQDVLEGCRTGELLVDPGPSPWDVCKSRTAWEDLAR